MAALRALLGAAGGSPPLPPTATIGTGEPDQTIPSTAAVVGGEREFCWAGAGTLHPLAAMIGRSFAPSLQLCRALQLPPQHCPLQDARPAAARPPSRPLLPTGVVGGLSGLTLCLAGALVFAVARIYGWRFVRLLGRRSNVGAGAKKQSDVQEALEAGRAGTNLRLPSIVTSRLAQDSSDGDDAALPSQTTRGASRRGTSTSAGPSSDSPTLPTAFGRAGDLPAKISVISRVRAGAGGGRVQGRPNRGVGQRGISRYRPELLHMRAQPAPQLPPSPRLLVQQPQPLPAQGKGGSAPRAQPMPRAPGPAAPPPSMLADQPGERTQHGQPEPRAHRRHAAARRRLLEGLPH